MLPATSSRRRHSSAGASSEWAKVKSLLRLSCVSLGRESTASSASSCFSLSRSAHRYTGWAPASMRSWPALSGLVRAASSASSTMFMRSGPVMVSEDHLNSPEGPNMATQEVRGMSERNSRT